MELENDRALPIVAHAAGSCACGADREAEPDLGRFSGLEKGHVIRTFVEEHANLLALADALEASIEAIERRSTWSETSVERATVLTTAERLIAAEPHHVREERVLFVRMSERGVVGAPAVMTREHDILRGLERRLLDVARRTDGDFRVFKRELASIGGSFLPELREHIFKENNVLYPYALRVIDDAASWTRMKAECDAIGYCASAPSTPRG